MDVSRRTFIKTTIVGGVGVSAFGFDLAPVYAQTQGLKIDRTTETRSTCPYCSVSCGVIIHTIGDKAKNVTPQVVHVEGDPDHPINRGTLCPKGASLEQEIRQRAPVAETAGAAAGFGSLGRHFLGRCVQRDRRLGEEDARRNVRRERRARFHRQSLRRNWLDRRLH